ncbi:MAG: FUSC family protein [Synechococcus sp.]
MPLRPLSPQQTRNALLAGFAGFVATALYLWAGPDAVAQDGFYLVYGAVRSLLPSREASLQAARARLLGSAFGGVVVFLVMLALRNWLAMGVAYVLIHLIGRRCRFSSATLVNAGVMVVLLLGVPSYGAMGFRYVFDRCLWHALGLGIGMAVERLFWPDSPLQRLIDSERALVQRLEDLLAGQQVASAEALITRYAEHRAVRSEVLRGADAALLQTPSFRDRHDCLEIALRHAVAMLRAPAVLQSLDERACREALGRYSREEEPA